MNTVAAGEVALVRMAVDLGALTVGGALSAAETTVANEAVEQAPPTSKALLKSLKQALQAGADPLGVRFCALRSPATRRQTGAVYTPQDLVGPMVDWVLEQEPVRLIDPGSGSGRFILEAARRRPGLEFVAVDLDPVATLMTRAGFAALELENVRVLNTDFLHLDLPQVDSTTAFIGNPPYVRHHALTPATKAWAQQAATRLDLSISGLAGLHAYFFLAVARQGRSGDVGCFVTSAEWLDVNYGAIVRALLLDRLGGESIHVVAPEAMPFDRTATTAAITCYRVRGSDAAIRFRPVAKLADVAPLNGTGEAITRARLRDTNRWSTFVRTRNDVPEGYIELGELCRVHRGAATGSNRTWVTQPSASDLPDCVLFPSITRARELFSAGAALTSAAQLKLVIDIPANLDELPHDGRLRVERFIKAAHRAGVQKGYIASHRSAWWSVGLRAPAPILATYMARRPPAFVRNLAHARHINVAHGIYPRENLPEHVLDRLTECLRTSITLAQGRTYAGGLTKFEPREMERLPVPSLDSLLAS